MKIPTEVFAVRPCEGQNEPFPIDRMMGDLETVPILQQPVPTEIDLSRHRVYVPVASHVEMNTDCCLRAYEAIGGRVDRSPGSSAIDLARCVQASIALEEGLDSLLFIDSDMTFEVDSVLRMFSRPEPLVGGLYAKKMIGEHAGFNFKLLPGTGQIRLGEWAEDLLPVLGFGAGFMRIKCSLLQRLVEELKLPRCRFANRWAWPFFMPGIVERDGELNYLCEDYAFCHRCTLIGVQPMLDVQHRLYHIGGYPHGIEEACGKSIPRVDNHTVQVDTVLAPDPLVA